MCFESMIAMLLVSGPAGESAAVSTLEYSGPEELQGAASSAFTFSRWEPGAELYVVSHNTNLRNAPNPQAAIVATLPMASRVRVLAVASGPTTVLGKYDRWYQVQTLGQTPGGQGFLFGMVLTPAAFVADLDGDGEDELATVAFTQDFKIRVRVREPALATPEHVALDLAAVGGGYLSRRGGLTSVTLIPAARAGVPLLELRAFVEACADFSTYWVSYQVPGAARGTAGQLKLALTQSGVADPPVHSSYQVSFDAGTRSATVVQTTSGEGEDGKEQTSTTTRRYRLTEGVFQEQR